MGERVGRREIEGKMEVNEGKDGKINTKGAEKKGRQNWKKKFWKEKEEKEKGGKVKEERTGRINLVPEGRHKILGGKLEEGKGNIKTETVNYIYPLC